MTMRKRLPHNLDAEACVLGGVLLGGRMSAAVRHLRDRDFLDPKHQAIWSAFRAIDSRHEPIDVVTVEAELLALG